MSTYTENEKWIDDGRFATVTGRVRVPAELKTFAWYWRNDDEPNPPQDYMVGKPAWLRGIAWALRNPLQNAGKYGIGVVDRNYTVTGTAPVLLTAWNDLPDYEAKKLYGLVRGWKWSVIWLGRVPLPFVSYTGKRVMWYAGWQSWGFFGFKFNILRSSIQVA